MLHTYSVWSQVVNKTENRVDSLSVIVNAVDGIEAMRIVRSTLSSANRVMVGFCKVGRLDGDEWPNGKVVHISEFAQ